MPTDQSAAYKLLFSTREMVRALVQGFVPDDNWLHSLDYATLEKMPCSYISDDMHHDADDVVWRVKVGGDWVYLYLLIQCESQVDPWMAVQVMRCVGLLYQDLIKADQVLPDNKLPPVLPIVLYIGDAPWTAATNIHALIPQVPGLVSQFLPNLPYLLIAENQYTDTMLAEMKNLLASALLLQRPHNQAAAQKLLDLLESKLTL